MHHVTARCGRGDRHGDVTKAIAAHGSRLLPPDEGASDRDADTLHEVAQDVDDCAAQVDVAAVLPAVAVPVPVTTPCAVWMADILDDVAVFP
jgi:hypothetical protein